MKKITVFGATGGTGKQFVEQALASRNEVVAYVRNPSKLGIVDEHLSIVQGELTDVALIERAITGADAVIAVSLADIFPQRCFVTLVDNQYSYFCVRPAYIFFNCRIGFFPDENSMAGVLLTGVSPNDGICPRI